MAEIYQRKDYKEEAWANFLMQYKNSPKLEYFVKGLFEPLNIAQKMAIDMIDQRTLQTATGAQLDGIARIVGISRPIVADNVLYFGFFGQTNIDGFGRAPFIDLYAGQQKVNYLQDSDFRSLIYFKIALNNGHGTAQEIAEAVRIVFNASQLRITEVGNAKIRIFYDQHRAPEYLLENPERYIPKLAGVGVEMFGELAKLFFGFQGQPNVRGFGQAPFITAQDILRG